MVGGLTPACTARALRGLRPALDNVVPVSTPEVAEMTKLLENIFRSVNIALINELAMLCDRMKIDVWEVIDAAATKPFGFMKFQPGPGLGGHCIPIDPFYLSWKAREFDFWTEFIELAGKINENMPDFCVEKLHRALNDPRQEPQRGQDARRSASPTSPTSTTCARARRSRSSACCASTAPTWTTTTRTAPRCPEFGLESVDLEEYRRIAGYDAVLIVTAHSALDYRTIVHEADLVVDFRNATAGIPSAGNVWKL